MENFTKNELIEQCYEHLRCTTGQLYSKTKDDRDTVHKAYPWMDHVIWEAFSDGKFYDFVDDKLISGDLMIEIIEYCSDYHKQREKDNGSLTNKVIPKWVDRYLDRQVVIQHGHSVYSILDLFGEAVCYMNREEAYTQILFVVNTHLDLRTLKDKVESDMDADPVFRDWINNQKYFCKVTSYDFKAPRKIERQVCRPPPCMFEEFVVNGVTYEDLRFRYKSFLENREVNMKEVSAILKKEKIPEDWIDATTAVDVFGWDKCDVLVFIDNYKRFNDLKVPRRSSRLKRKRSS